MVIIRVDKSMFSDGLMYLQKNTIINYWYLLLDNNNKPVKEIAFDENDLVVYKAPNKRDYGLFSDSPIVFESIEDYELIDEYLFNSIWNKI